MSLTALWSHWITLRVTFPYVYYLLALHNLCTFLQQETFLITTLLFFTFLCTTRSSAQTQKFTLQVSVCALRSYLTFVLWWQSPALYNHSHSLYWNKIQWVSKYSEIDDEDIYHSVEQLVNRSPSMHPSTGFKQFYRLQKLWLSQMYLRKYTANETGSTLLWSF